MFNINLFGARRARSQRHLNGSGEAKKKKNVPWFMASKIKSWRKKEEKIRNGGVPQKKVETKKTNENNRKINSARPTAARIEVVLPLKNSATVPMIPVITPEYKKSSITPNKTAK